MGLKEQFDRVKVEFVSGDRLLAALVLQEGISEVQAASWFMRCIHELNELPMLEYCATREDFHPIDAPWASDVFADILMGDRLGVTWVDTESEDGHEYVGGWLSDDLKDFFARQGVSFPADALRAIASGGRTHGLRRDLSAVDLTAPDDLDASPDLSEQLRGQLRSLQAELEQKALSTRERNTLLTIIAALCAAANIDPAARGAATKIAEATDLLGAPVDDGTVLKWLKQVPDAVRSRSK